MSEKVELEIHGEDELEKAAELLLRFAKSNSIFAFYGQMGAGKTTFIRYICKALEVKNTVNSPTFSIINEYNCPTGSIYHFDFYRLEKEEEAIHIGCEEYFESGAICLIEWPENILNLLPHPLIKITLQLRSYGRLITFEYD